MSIVDVCHVTKEPQSTKWSVLPGGKLTSDYYKLP